jgi:hypothetical protein
VEPFLGVTTTTHNYFVNNRGQIFNKYESDHESHMDDKAHEGIRVHERKKGDGDSM